jgi:hypothetical protein
MFRRPGSTLTAAYPELRISRKPFAFLGACAVGGLLALHPPDISWHRASSIASSQIGPTRPRSATAALLRYASTTAASRASAGDRALGRRLASRVTPEMRGASGRVRIQLLTPWEAQHIPELAGVRRGPALYQTADPASPSAFAFITLRPFDEKRGDRIGAYRMGYWPSELTLAAATPGYESPAGFIEVTRDMQTLRVSDHFQLGDFITHDQVLVWPKYVVLQEQLLDKLELVLLDLSAHGIRADHPLVLSGFRTPLHNAFGLGGESGAPQSRHQYGDAADLIIDNDRDGRMDDLNLDGRVDTRDIDLVLDAVERVERRYPSLVGGAGRYHAIGPSGPFVHIDVRGYRARWGNSTPTRIASATAGASTGQDESKLLTPIGSCHAPAAFAMLCGRER